MPIALGEQARRRVAASSGTHLEETWCAWFDHRCVEARNRLVEHYMRSLVRPIAIRVRSGLPQIIDVDDLIQQGYLGLVDALGRFEQGRQARFETFARPRVFGSIQDYLRSIDHVPRLTRIRAKKMQSLREQFLMMHGRPATAEDVGRLMDLEGSESDPQLRRLLTQQRPAAMVPFSSVCPEGSESSDDADAMDSFEDENHDDPHMKAARLDLQQMIVRGFDQRDRLIVVLYYYEQMTMREVGDALGISESRVSQRLDSILSCLRARLAGTGVEHEFVFA